MFKFLKTLALAAVIALGGWGGIHGAKAEHTAIVGSTFTGVGDVSSVLDTKAKDTTVTILINGVYDMVIALQREVGSKGSGAFQTLPGFKDISPGANDQTRISFKTEAANDRFRLKVTTDTSGTAVYAMFDGRRTIPSFPASTHVDFFDDFNGADVATTGDTAFTHEYAYFINTSGTPADVLLTVQEGAMDMTAGGGAAQTPTQDTTAISLDVVANNAALVSDGDTFVEWRAQTSLLVGTQIGFGLSDVVAVNAAIPLFNWDTNVVTDTAATNDIAIGHSTDSTGGLFWSVASTNAGAVGNNDDEWACETAIAAATYYRLGILINDTGDAFFYVDGVLCGAEPLAVATTARLLPYAWATSAVDDDTGATIIIMDYVDFKMARPSS